MDTSQSMLLHIWARPMCMRVLVRMRGYVSTSSCLALFVHMHEPKAARVPHEPKAARVPPALSRSKGGGSRELKRVAIGMLSASAKR